MFEKGFGEIVGTVCISCFCFPLQVLKRLKEAGFVEEFPGKVGTKVLNCLFCSNMVLVFACSPACSPLLDP